MIFDILRDTISRLVKICLNFPVIRRIYGRKCHHHLLIIPNFASLLNRIPSSIRRQISISLNDMFAFSRKSPKITQCRAGGCESLVFCIKFRLISETLITAQFDDDADDFRNETQIVNLSISRFDDAVWIALLFSCCLRN